MNRFDYAALTRDAQDRFVITTAGYSAQGYANPSRIAQEIQKAIGIAAQTKPDANVLLVSGGTRDGGICDLTHDVAMDVKRTHDGDLHNQFHYATLTSRTAEANNVPLYSDPDTVCLVPPQEPGSWDVRIATRTGKTVSGTADIGRHSRHGHVLLVFQGGAVTAAEAKEAIDNGSTVVVYTGADFAPNPQNLEKAIAKLVAGGQSRDQAKATVAARARAVSDALPPGVYKDGARIAETPDLTSAIPIRVPVPDYDLDR